MTVNMKNFFVCKTYREDYYQNKFAKYCLVKLKSGSDNGNDNILYLKKIILY